MSALNQNLDALEAATVEIRQTMEIDRDDSYLPGHATRRFRHLVLLECAERISAEEFAKCVQIAKDRLGRCA